MTIDGHITAVLVDIMGVPRFQVTPEACLYSDLDFDSLDHVEFIMAVEEEFEIEFRDHEAEAIKTVADAVKAVEAKLQPVAA